MTFIAISNIVIAICNMRLGEKIRYLREVEGSLRGMGREMTQLEIVRAIKKELSESLSQSYLSQIENGSRPHLTNKTRMLLARFFKVHPGYLVDDPIGYHGQISPFDDFDRAPDFKSVRLVVDLHRLGTSKPNVDRPLVSRGCVGCPVGRSRAWTARPRRGWASACCRF